MFETVFQHLDNINRKFFYLYHKHWTLCAHIAVTVSGDQADFYRVRAEEENSTSVWTQCFFLVAVCTAARVSLKWMREPVFFCRSAWNCCYGGRQRRHRRRETSLVYNPPVCVDYLLRIPLWHRSHVCVHDVRLQTKRSANTNSCSPWDHTGRLDPADVFNVYLFCMFILHLKRSRTRNSSVSAFVKTFLRSCRYIGRA